MEFGGFLLKKLKISTNYKQLNGLNQNPVL